MEGILLQKIEDEVEKELTVRGTLLGWDIMNEEKFEKERKEREFKLNLDLINEDVGQANIKEKEFKDQCEKEEKERKNRRLDIQKEWKELWGEIWIPNIAYNGDESLVNKRNLIQKIIMEVTFKIFKKEMYDVWKFKNILNNKDQYIIMEKIKNLKYS